MIVFLCVGSAALAIPELRLVFGTASIPHPAKQHKGGEDAFFADEAIGAFGVADGVGGSAVNGIDPGVFSRRLLKLCHGDLLAGDESSTLRGAVVAAAEAFATPSINVGGHSTLLLGRLAPEGMLHLLNIGDSGVMVYRPSPRRLHGYEKPVRWPRLVARTHEAQHYFNCPYQVSADTLLEKVMTNADELQVALRPGDVVIAATDGVLDNLFQSHIQVRPRP